MTKFRFIESRLLRIKNYKIDLSFYCCITFPSFLSWACQDYMLDQFPALHVDRFLYKVLDTLGLPVLAKAFLGCQTRREYNYGQFELPVAWFTLIGHFVKSLDAREQQIFISAFLVEINNHGKNRHCFVRILVVHPKNILYSLNQNFSVL